MMRALLGFALVLLLTACSTTPPPQNLPPRAAFTVTPVEGTTHVFTATGSFDPDGTILSYQWSLGDGTTASGPVVTHTYRTHGIFTARLTVTDDGGATDKAEATIPIGGLSGELGVGTAGGAQGRRVPVSVRDAAALPAAEAPFVPGELIVAFAPTVSPSAALSVAGTALQLVRPLAIPNTALYRAADAVALQASEAVTLDLARQLTARPEVLEAHPNYLLTATRSPNDPLYALQWHYPAINLPQAWDLTTGSTATVVAVLDTGILYDAGNPARSHPDLVGKVLPGYDFISDPTRANDGDGRDPNPYDDGDNPGGQASYHGSHVAGTIAAATNNAIGVAGVDWQARILPVRVLGVGGGTFVDILEGMLWSVGLEVPGVPHNPHPAAIVNMSLGGPFSCTATMQSAIDEALATGAIIVVAAGNENTNAATYAPASCAGVITVGATDARGFRAPYSNYGSRIDVMAPGGDMAADRNNDGRPDGVLSLWRNDTTQTFDYAFSQGTSMATPHVAGVIALMKSLRPALSAAEALAILTSTARPLSAEACNRPSGSECGAGLIDAYAALRALETPPPPVGELRFTPAVLDFGLTIEELEVTLSNGGGASLTWEIAYYAPAPDNPGPTPQGTVYVASGFPRSGTLAAGESTVTRIGIDRSFVTTDGFYQLELIFVENGSTERRLPVRFTRGAATHPTPTGPTVVAGFIELAPGEFLVSGYAKQDRFFTSYSFPTLAGSTVVVAWVDENGNNEVDEGDYLGVYPTRVTVVGGEIAQSINLTLAPVVEVSAVEPYVRQLETLLAGRSD